jgi:hypothetical protein
MPLFIVGRALPPGGIERLELDHLEVDLDEDLLEHLLAGSFIGSDSICPEPDEAITNCVFSGWSLRIAGLRHQLARRLRRRT